VSFPHEARGAFAADWRAGIRSIREIWLSPSLRTALWLCVPALVLGALLRIYLCIEAPYGYFLSDTRNFIDGAEDFLKNPLSVLGGSSRTFLASAVYSLPIAMGIPVLRAIPWIQHAIGLWMIVAAGLLCAAWLPRWRWCAVPVTLIVAVHPSILWYEHMALPESMFVVLTLTTALGLALFLRAPSPPSFLVLLASIFFTAGARQEGFLYAIVALAGCVLAFRRDRRRMAIYLGATFLFLFATTRASRTTQGGQMLITSLIHHASDRLWSVPDYSERAVALRNKFKPQWPIYPANHNESRDIIVGDVREFLIEKRGLSAEAARRSNNSFCKRVAIEIAIRNFWVLPGMAYYKWLATHIEAPTPAFANGWMTNYAMKKVFGGEKSKEKKFLPRFYGRAYETADAFERDLRQIYYPEHGLGWLDAWRAGFTRWTLWPHVQASIRSVSEENMMQHVPRLPLLYPLGLAGLIGAVLITEKRKRMALLTWLGMLIFTGFVVVITGSLRSRYRLAFEPYWFIGLTALCAVFAALWARLKGRRP